MRSAGYEAAGHPAPLDRTAALARHGPERSAQTGTARAGPALLGFAVLGLVTFVRWWL
ncbi:hypothetical protein [Kitasatospora sp. NPDC054795]